MAWAKGLGFQAAKLELLISGPYAHQGLDERDELMVETIRAVREAAGPEFAIMVDVGYAWDDADRALAVIETWAEYDVFFVETPLWIDDLEGYRRLAERSPIRIAAGEWQATRFEFLDLMDRGGIHVVQPDVGRVGGLTEARRVCELGGRARSAGRPARLEDGYHHRGHGAAGGDHGRTCRSSSSCRRRSPRARCAAS